MDQSRFDDLTRRLAAGTSRRTGLKAALGGILGMAAGLAALPAADLAAKKKKKKRTLCPTVCPSGSACVNGACACTRPLCGGVCCASDHTACENGQCVYTGQRDCSGVKIVDGADLSFCNLRGKEIPNRTLRNANFEGADLSGARFTGQFQPWMCSFRSANLDGADLHECDIKPGTSFVGASLRGARLTQGHIDSADFSWANLTGAMFGNSEGRRIGSRITNTRFEQAYLTGADLYGCSIQNSDFTNADLARAIFWRAAISQSDMSGAALDSSRLAGARIADSVLDGAVLDGARLGSYQVDDGVDSTWISQCSMVGASMRDQHYVDLAAVPTLAFVDVDLRNATFSTPYPRDGAAWLRTNLTGATGWRQPEGGYELQCSLTLPDGSQAPDTGWFRGEACPRAN